MSVDGQPDESDVFRIDPPVPDATYYEPVDDHLVDRAAAYAVARLDDEVDAEEVADREARLDRAETLALAAGRTPEADLAARAARVETFTRTARTAWKEAERKRESPDEARERIEAAGEEVLLDPDDPEPEWLAPDEVPTVGVALVEVHDAVQTTEVEGLDDFEADLRAEIAAERDEGRAR